METYVCRRFRLYQKLCDEGYFPFKIAKDARNPKYNVFLFDKSEEVMRVVNNYYEELERVKK